MSKKSIALLVTSIGLLFMMSGCTISEQVIDLDTPISAVSNDGLFTVILTYPLAQAINFLSEHLNSVFLGIAIVAIVLNAIIIALTFKSNVAMQKMQEIQPEVLKIQAKYEGRDDQASQQRQAAELQALYAKYGINPFGSLLTTFIQLPVLFSMYAAVRKSAAVANGSFLGATLSTTPKEAIKGGVWVLIGIYVLMIICQLLSTSIARILQESRAKKEADKRHKHYEKSPNNNILMTYGMVLFIGFIMLDWPTALSLYYFIYSIINIVKTIVIDKITHKD